MTWRVTASAYKAAATAAPHAPPASLRTIHLPALPTLRRAMPLAASYRRPWLPTYTASAAAWRHRQRKRRIIGENVARKKA